MSPFKRAVKSTPSTVIGSRILAEQFSGVRDRFSKRRRLMGSTHRGLSLEQSVSYVETVYEDYVSYGAVAPEKLNGSRVLELGPGDNLGVAMRFVADGAAEVISLDRFATWRDPGHQATIYREIARDLQPDQLENLSGTYRADGTIDEHGGRITLVEGIAIEDAREQLGDDKFDLIVSRAVLEHVLDLPAAFEAMDQLLTDEGTLIHKVDLSDHGMFTGGGHHPLTFLTLSDRLWELMGAQQGIPNRQRIATYRDLLEKLGYEFEILISALASDPVELVPALRTPDPQMQADSEALVEQIRGKLAPRYAQMGAADLTITDFFLIARRKRAAQRT